MIITVADSGCGIAPEQQARIFERFARLESADASVKGTGIGLALVKALVESHQGSIQLDSQPGTGSTFTVELPLSEQQAGADKTLPKEPLAPARDIIHASIATLQDDDMDQQQEDDLLVAPEDQSDQHNILIVEDSRDMRHFIRRCLRNL